MRQVEPLEPREPRAKRRRPSARAHKDPTRAELTDTARPPTHLHTDDVQTTGQFYKQQNVYYDVTPPSNGRVSEERQIRI